MKDGTLFSWLPGLSLKVPDAPQLYDFIGLNFYSRVIIESSVAQTIIGCDSTKVAYPSCRSGEVMTDMQYPVCAESLYYAIKEIAKLNVPIYITENGIADAKDDRRAVYIKRYLYALSRAIQEGYDVRGYYYWSLVDNFEWNEGWSKKFGLYAHDRSTGTIRLRNGGYAYKDALQHATRMPLITTY